MTPADLHTLAEEAALECYSLDWDDTDGPETFAEIIERALDKQQAQHEAERGKWLDSAQEKLLAMTDEQVQALCRLEGHDPKDEARIAEMTTECALLKSYLKEAAREAGLPEDSIDIAGCNVLAHQIKAVVENYKRLAAEHDAAVAEALERAKKETIKRCECYLRETRQGSICGLRKQQQDVSRSALNPRSDLVCVPRSALRVLEAAKVLTPLLDEGWDEYDTPDDQNIGARACEELQAATKAWLAAAEGKR